MAGQAVDLKNAQIDITMNENRFTMIALGNTLTERNGVSALFPDSHVTFFR
ncbi:MAG: hypothetical protein IT445_03270 [Phycisphaeraceae bacterium]|nr:hypothetical protein [Phycisphaeraceae bacterium]